MPLLRMLSQHLVVRACEKKRSKLEGCFSCPGITDARHHRTVASVELVYTMKVLDNDTTDSLSRELAKTNLLTVFEGVQWQAELASQHTDGINMLVQALVHVQRIAEQPQLQCL